MKTAVSRLAIRAILEKRGIQFQEPQKSEEYLNKAFTNVFKSILETASFIQKRQYDSKLSVEHFNEALTLKNMKPLLGYRSKQKVEYETAGFLDNTKIEIPVDKQIDIQSIIDAQLLPYPIEKYYSFHWLSVLNGVQPRIPQNEKYVFIFLFTLYYVKNVSNSLYHSFAFIFSNIFCTKITNIIFNDQFFNI